MVLDPDKKGAGQADGQAGEGGGPAAAAGPAPAKAVRNPRVARQTRMSQAFSQVVAVLMRDPNFRNMKLSDLEWLVLPPIMAGQFKLGHARAPQRAGAKGPSDMLVPVAVALWARVSSTIDKALSERLGSEMRLRPTDWATGDIVWLMAAAGNPRAVPMFLKQLKETQFKDQEVKLRTRAPDGTIVVKTLSEYA